MMPGFDREIARMADRLLIKGRPIDYHTGVFATKVTPGVPGERPCPAWLFGARWLLDAWRCACVAAQGVGMAGNGAVTRARWAEWCSGRCCVVCRGPRTNWLRPVVYPCCALHRHWLAAAYAVLAAQLLHVADSWAARILPAQLTAICSSCTSSSNASAHATSLCTSQLHSR